MHIFKIKNELTDFISGLKSKNKTVGFVPTMGALHEGHLSLIDFAQKQNDLVVVSIFVNPTQFNNPDDLEKYPVTTEADIELLEEKNVDVLFLPTVDEIYGEKIIADIYDFGNLDKVMEGEHRKGHFDGVATIVKLLFNAVKPDKAYFGEKDFQQLQIIRKMVEINHLPVQIEACPIVREEDGLAMSSRNMRLSTEHRKEAPFIYETLQKARQMSKNSSVDEVKNFVKREFKSNRLLDLEYFEIRDELNLDKIADFQDNMSYRAFIAVFAGDIRLIDNLRLI